MSLVLESVRNPSRRSKKWVKDPQLLGIPSSLTNKSGRTLSGLKGGSERLGLGESPDNFRKALRYIEAGSANKTQELLIGVNLLRSLDFSSTDYLLDGVVRLIDAITHLLSASLPHSIVEKIVEVLPSILATIMERGPNTLPSGCVDNLVNKLREFKQTINKKILGGPELHFHTKISLSFIRKLPQVTDRESIIISFFGVASNILKCVFTPHVAPYGDIVADLFRFGQYVTDTMWSKDTRQFLDIHKQALIVQLDVNERNSNEARRNLQKYIGKNKKDIQKVLILALKNRILAKEDENLLNEFSGLFLNMCLKKKIRPIALRACFELSHISNGFEFKVNRMLTDNAHKFRSDRNYLTKNLIDGRHYIIEFLHEIDQNWRNCVGVHRSVYENMKSTLKAAFEKKLHCNMRNSIDLLVSEDPLGNTQHEPIREKIEEFLNNDQYKTCLLLGDPGCGKSTFCYRLKYEMLKEMHDFLPIYINLLSVKDFENKLVKYAFGTKYNIKKNPVLNGRKILFIIDSYDELKQKFNVIANNRIFVAYPQSKIIIACNTYLQPNRDYFYRDYTTDGLSEIHFLYIQPLNSAQIEKYMGNKHEQLKARLAEDLDLKELVSNTFLLNYYAKDRTILEYIREDQSKYSYISTLIESMLKRNERRRKKNIHVREKPTTDKTWRFLKSKCQKLAEEYLKNQIFTMEVLEHANAIPIVDGVPLTVQEFNTENKPLHFKFLNDTILSYFAAGAVMSKEPRNTEEIESSLIAKTDITDRSRVLYFLSESITKREKKLLCNVLRESQNELLKENSRHILYSCGYSKQEVAEIEAVNLPDENRY